jgi:hypothetical protein
MDSYNVFDGMSKTMHTILDAKEGQLSTPRTIEIEFTGTKAEAMGSARHVADMIQESGYTTDTEWVEEVDPIPGTDERHSMKIEITE